MKMYISISIIIRYFGGHHWRIKCFPFNSLKWTELNGGEVFKVTIVRLEVTISSSNVIFPWWASSMILSFNTKHCSIGWLMRRWYLQYFGSFVWLASSGCFIFGNSINSNAIKWSNIPETFEFENGYCVFCISCNFSFLFPLSWACIDFSSFILGLNGTLKGVIVTIKDCLFSALKGNFPPLWQSCFSWTGGPWRPLEAILSSISWARVSNSSKVLGLFP